MRLVDTNVLVNAHRSEAPRHKQFHEWLDGLINGDEPYGVADFVVNGFIRLVTSRRIYRDPSPLVMALDFAERYRNQPHATVVTPGADFWRIFTEVCGTTEAKGKLIPDAYLAALAIEHGCEFVTADGDFAQFPGLRWRHPLN